MNKDKFNLIYKHFAKPIYDLAMTYERYKDILKVQYETIYINNKVTNN